MMLKLASVSAFRKICTLDHEWKIPIGKSRVNPVVKDGGPAAELRSRCVLFHSLLIHNFSLGTSLDQQPGGLANTRFLEGLQKIGPSYV